MKRKILAVLCLVAAMALTLGATRSRYVMYDGVAPGASANRLWTPTYLATAFVPDEVTFYINGATNTQYIELTVYLCDTLSVALTTQAAATDSFTVKPTSSATGSATLEYVGPMSGQMRLTTPANHAGSIHAFK